VRWLGEIGSRLEEKLVSGVILVGFFDADATRGCMEITVIIYVWQEEHVHKFLKRAFISLSRRNAGK
jgi:hypothetical protein